MLKNTNFYWLGAGFVAGFFAVGIPYWQIPYAKVSLPDALYNDGLVVVGILAAAVCFFARTGFVATNLAIGAAVPAAVLARVAVETAADPSSHNLWPFELIIAGFVGLVCSSAGAVLGSIASLLSKGKVRKAS